METCLVIATGLLVIWFFKPVKGLIIAAAVVGFIGAFIPSLAKWINWFWYKLAEVMGFVMSKVLLSIVFYVFLFPIALIYRMTKKDTLQLKKKSDTYWTSRSHSYSSKDLEQVW